MPCNAVLNIRRVATSRVIADGSGQRSSTAGRRRSATLDRHAPMRVNVRCVTPLGDDVASIR
jgi:hypothetical protein